MSMESKSYKKIPETPHNIFWVELGGNREEFNSLSEDFEKNQIHFEGKLAYPPMAMALPPHPIFFEIIAAVGSLIAVADILHKHLKGKKDDRERTITFKFNGKEMKIQGNYTKEEILLIIQKFSKIAAPKDVSAISAKRKKQFKSELKELQQNLKTYQKLVEVGERQEKPNKQWKSKLKQYQLKKAEIESKIGLIEELLRE